MVSPQCIRLVREIRCVHMLPQAKSIARGFMLVHARQIPCWHGAEALHDRGNRQERRGSPPARQVRRYQKSYNDGFLGRRRRGGNRWRGMTMTRWHVARRPRLVWCNSGAAAVTIQFVTPPPPRRQTRGLALLIYSLIWFIASLWCNFA